MSLKINCIYHLSTIARLILYRLILPLLTGFLPTSTLCSNNDHVLQIDSQP